MYGVYLLDNRLPDLPPLGKFFDPYHGYLALHDSDKLPEEDLFFQGLHDSVTVVWDERRIPHIFANIDISNSFEFVVFKYIF